MLNLLSHIWDWCFNNDPNLGIFLFSVQRAFISAKNHQDRISIDRDMTEIVYGVPWCPGDCPWVSGDLSRGHRLSNHHNSVNIYPIDLKIGANESS